MATAATSKAKLDSAQRAWLKKMGAALDAPVAEAALSGDKQAFIGDLGDLIPDARTSNITIKNNSNKPLQIVPGSAKVETKPAEFVKAPPLEISPNGEASFAVSNALIGSVPAPVGTGGQIQYDVVGDEKNTRLFMQWECGFVLPSRTTIERITPKNDAVYSLKGFNTAGNDFAFIFTSRGGPGPGPTPPPSGVDAASSCHITVTNDTQVVLTFGGSGHERGNFMTPPAKSLKPGESTTFVSVEVPNASDKKEEGCKGHVLWQLGSPNVLWRIEWDNPEQQQNVVSHSFNPPNSGFNSANFIGQGEENVPVSFTISGSGGGVTPPPPGAGGKVEFTVIDATADKVLERATIQAAGKSAKTSAAGTAEMELPAGTQAYVVTADGFEENKGTIEITSGKDADRVVFMKMGAAKGSKVTFLVIDALVDKLLEGASIECAGKSAKTGKGGTAEMELPAGTQAFLATADGYEDNQGTVEVTSGEDSKRTIFMNAKPAEGKKTKVKFTVTDKEAGTPIAGANIKLGTQTAQTDNAGVSTLDVEAGSLSYVVQKDEYQDATGKVEAKPDTETHQDVQLEKEPAFNPPPESKQPTLRKGDKSADGWVEYLQKLLNKYLGKGTVPEDGVFEQKTYDAVKKFQASTKPPCLVDGIVGNETWSMLRKGEREKVGVNEQDDEKGAEGRWATEKNDFVTYDAASDELRMIAFSVGDAPIDKYKANFRVTSADKKVQKVFERVIGAPTGPSPTGSGHMHVVKVEQMAATYGNGDVLVEAYLEELLGGDLWKGTVKVAGTAPPSTQTGDIGFTVTDEKSGKPISGAAVTLGGLSKSTDAVGTALFAKAPAGKHPFTVSHKAFEPASGEAEVLPDASTPKAVKLKPKSSPPPSGKTGDIGFTVTNEKTGKPISGAKVTLGKLSKSTDAEGIALFAKAPAGKHQFTVSHKDFQSASGDAEVLPNASTPKAVKLKPNAGPPSTGGSVGFIITDQASGDLITGATVSIAGRKAATALGVVKFDDLAPASYPYTVTHSSYESASGGVDVEENTSISEEVKLKPKAAPPSGAPGSVGFSVTDKASGNPISGATVNVAGHTAPTNASGGASFDGLQPASYPYTVSHPSYETAKGGVDVEANETRSESVQLVAITPDQPKRKTTDDDSPGGEPPEHRLVKKQTFTHKVNLKDTNYANEELGHWLLRMEVGLSGTGQVYPLHIDLVPKLKNPANNIINIFPTIKAKSENLNGVRSCDVTFNVQVAGPNVSSQSGGKFGGSIGWKDATERLEAGLSAEWTVSESHTSQAGGAWSRRFHISGGDVLGFSQDKAWKEDLTGDMVIDDDHGHDQWGVDTDWELHTYDG